MYRNILTTIDFYHRLRCVEIAKKFNKLYKNIHMYECMYTHTNMYVYVCMSVWMDVTSTNEEKNEKSAKI